jgi:hypothetical protein
MKTLLGTHNFFVMFCISRASSMVYDFVLMIIHLIFILFIVPNN